MPKRKHISSYNIKMLYNKVALKENAESKPNNINNIIQLNKNAWYV